MVFPSGEMNGTDRIASYHPAAGYRYNPAMGKPRNLLVLLTAVLLCAACDTRAFSQDVAIEVAFADLTFERPVFVTAPGDGSDRLFVIEQPGRVLWFDNRRGVTQRDLHVALDIRRRVNYGGEQGLLGIAFPPDFEKTHHVYLHYSRKHPRRNVLSRWTMDAAGETIDPDSEQVILEVRQPYNNHNGGMIAFGPPPGDGYLYIALGDGGAGGDPHGNGQDLSTLLGSILRIDPAHPSDGRPYGIPDDNPFVDVPGARPEIYAYGLRNPWRFSFDPQTGDLWAGDVGQNTYEEVDLIVKGGNYGWNIREGFHPFKPAGRSTDGLIDPVAEYTHRQGLSITGGYVYRGEAIASLVGAYVYADFATGRVWMLRRDGGRVTVNRQIGEVSSPASFGTDAHGELYICSFDGHLYKFMPTAPAASAPQKPAPTTSP